MVIYYNSLLNNQCINMSMDQVSSYWIFFYLIYVYSIASLQAVSTSPFLPSLHFALSLITATYIHKGNKNIIQHTITIYTPTHIRSATIITTLTLNPHINVSYLHLFSSSLYIYCSENIFPQHQHTTPTTCRHLSTEQKEIHTYNKENNHQ